MATPAGPSDEEVLAGLQERKRSLRTAVSQLAELAYDPSFLSTGTALSAMGGRRARTVFEFVREHVAFEPYRGQVRGARGVLFSRAGNAVDRSLLAAEFLEELGISWRLVRGTLDSDQSRRILSGIVPTVSLTDADGQSVAGGDGGETSPERRLVRDHWWLEAEISGEWTPFDVTYPELSLGEQVTEPDERFGGNEIPDALRHDVLFRLRYRQAHRTSFTALTYSAELADLSYRNLLLSFSSVGTSRIRPTLEVPSATVEGESFQIAEAEEIWLEIEITVGEQTRRIRRELRSVADSADLFDSAVQVFSVLVLPGWVGEDYLRAVSGALAERIASEASTLIDAALEAGPGRRYTSALSEPTARLLGEAVGLIGLTFARVSDGITLGLAAEMGTRPYYEWPRVIVIGSTASGRGVSVQLDLRYDAVSGLAFAGLPERITTAFQVFRGAFENELAHRLLARLTGMAPVSAAGVLSTAQRMGHAFVSVGATDTRGLRGLDIDARLRDRISGDASEGGVIVVPADAVRIAGQERTAWFQVESRTGRVLAVLDDGVRGAAAHRLSTGGRVGSERPRRLLGVHETLGLVESLFASVAGGSSSTAGVGIDSCELLCGLERTSAAICADRGRLDIRACLGERETGDDDPLGFGLSCEEMAQNYRCGVLVGRHLLEGALQVDLGEVEAFRGPLESLRSPISRGPCGCDE